MGANEAGSRGARKCVGAVSPSHNHHMSSIFARRDCGKWWQPDRDGRSISSKRQKWPLTLTWSALGRVIGGPNVACVALLSPLAFMWQQACAQTQQASCNDEAIIQAVIKLFGESYALASSLYLGLPTIIYPIPTRIYKVHTPTGVNHRPSAGGPVRISGDLPDPAMSQHLYIYVVLFIGLLYY